LAEALAGLETGVFFGGGGFVGCCPLLGGGGLKEKGWVEVVRGAGLGGGGLEPGVGVGLGGGGLEAGVGVTLGGGLDGTVCFGGGLEGGGLEEVVLGEILEDGALKYVAGDLSLEEKNLSDDFLFLRYIMKIMRAATPAANASPNTTPKKMPAMSPRG